jgi:hypothetical protein
METVSKLVDTDGNDAGWVFWCPGCEHAHRFTVPPWTFNGDLCKPTVQGSILVRYDGEDDGKPVHQRCHLFVTDGKLRFLEDCTHRLRGQTVPMKALDTDP